MQRIKTTTAVVAGIVLMVTFSSAAQAAFILDSWATLVKPHPYEVEEFCTTGNNPVNVDFETADHQVSIDGNHGDVFLAVWDMALENLNQFGGSDFIDRDAEGRNVTLNNAGYWEHKAHDTGKLSGSRMLFNGNYTAYVKSRLDAERLADHVSSYNSYEIWKQFTVVNCD
jgi:hypothetical protein